MKSKRINARYDDRGGNAAKSKCHGFMSALNPKIMNLPTAAVAGMMKRRSLADNEKLA